MLYEVELIINNAPLIYVYPYTIKTCLTLNYLLFGRQLLSSSNTTTVAANLTAKQTANFASGESLFLTNLLVLH